MASRQFGYKQKDKKDDITGFRRSHKRIPTAVAMDDDQNEMSAKQAAIGKMGQSPAERQGIVPLANYNRAGAGFNMNQARSISPGGNNEPDTSDPNTDRTDPQQSGSSGSTSSSASSAARGSLANRTLDQERLARNAAAQRRDDIAVDEHVNTDPGNTLPVLPNPNDPDNDGVPGGLDPETGAFVPTWGEEAGATSSTGGTLYDAFGNPISISGEARPDNTWRNTNLYPPGFRGGMGGGEGGGEEVVTEGEWGEGRKGGWYDSISERIDRLGDPASAEKRIARQRAAQEAQIRATMGAGESGRSGAASLLQGEAGRLAEEQARTAELAKELDLAELESYMMGFDLEKERYDAVEKRQAMKAAYYMGSEYDMDYDAVMDFLGFNDAVRDDESRRAYNAWHQEQPFDRSNPQGDPVTPTSTGSTGSADSPGQAILGHGEVDKPGWELMNEITNGTQAASSWDEHPDWSDSANGSRIPDGWSRSGDTGWGEGADTGNRRYLIYTNDETGEVVYVVKTRVAA